MLWVFIWVGIWNLLESANPCWNSQHIMASMNYFDSDMDNSTNMVVCTVMSHTIYPAKFEQTITHQHVLLRRESLSYWWSILYNNIVCACFNCTSHIINFGYVDYFQWIKMCKTLTTVLIILFCDFITWLKCVHRACANDILPSD